MKPEDMGAQTAARLSHEKHESNMNAPAVGAGGGGKGMSASVTGSDTMITDQLLSASNMDSVLTVGEGMDSLTSSLGGSMSKNPFDEIAEGNMSPAGISHQGYNYDAAVKVSVNNITPGQQLNAGNVPSLISSNQQGHG